MLHSIPLSLKVGLVTMRSAKKEGWRYGVSNSQRDGSQGNVIYVRFWIIVTNARENPLTKIVRLFRVIMIARSGISTFCVSCFARLFLFQAKLCRCIVRCERRTISSCASSSRIDTNFNKYVEYERFLRNSQRESRMKF